MGATLTGLHCSLQPRCHEVREGRGATGGPDMSEEGSSLDLC